MVRKISCLQRKKIASLLIISLLFHLQTESLKENKEISTIVLNQMLYNKRDAVFFSRHDLRISS